MNYLKLNKQKAITIRKQPWSLFFSLKFWMARKWYRITAKWHKLAFLLMLVILERKLCQSVHTVWEFLSVIVWVHDWVWAMDPSLYGPEKKVAAMVSQVQINFYLKCLFPSEEIFMKIRIIVKLNKVGWGRVLCFKSYWVDSVFPVWSTSKIFRKHHSKESQMKIIFFLFYC